MKPRLIIPEQIARCMSAKDRAELGVKLQAECAADGAARLERDLQKLCEQELNRRGIAYLHLSPMAREKIGWPDLVFAVAGVPMAVELKAANGRVTPEQSAMLAKMEHNGWRVSIVRTFEEFWKVCNGSVETTKGGMGE